MSAAGPTSGAQTLRRHPEQLAVVKLPVGAELPSWVSSATLMSITATATETSVVCTAQAVPRKARPEGPFAAFEVAGPLDLALVGVLADLLAPLAEAEVSVFVISTFDTDWLLVPADSADTAAAAWTGQGHGVEAAPDPTPQRSPL